MARRKRPAAESDTRALDAHTPSSPSRPPVVCVYCSRESNADKLLIVSWATWEGAASFLEALIENEEGEPKWLKHRLGRWTQLVWPSGLTITTRSDETLEKLVETETDWELPEPYTGMVRQFLSDSPVVGADFERRPKERGSDPDKPKRTRGVKKERAPTKASNRPENFVHISELVPDVEAAHARAALRTLKWTKPEYGWWFDPARKAEVGKAIKGALK